MDFFNKLLQIYNTLSDLRIKILMIILIKLFLNSKLDLIELFRIQIKKGGKVLLWNHVKYRMEACYSELVFDDNTTW